jgi:hypothetical protein
VKRKNGEKEEKLRKIEEKKANARSIFFRSVFTKIGLD